MAKKNHWKTSFLRRRGITLRSAKIYADERRKHWKKMKRRGIR